jgi:predicted HAD superfamily Cof-like phosphohydrolase
MKSNFQRTADWLAACGKQPSVENLSLQIGCHIEEQVEFLATLAIIGPEDNQDAWHSRRAIATAIATLIALSDSLKKGTMIAGIPTPMREAALDALCDCDVTGNGVAYFAGFDKVTADELVLLSNERKLVDGKPVIKEGGKIGKPEGWVPPDLSDCI